MLDKGVVVDKTPRTPGIKAQKNHPPTSEMVTAAVTMLNERHGSSLQAIKKYISLKYHLDIDRTTPFIRKYIRTAVASGSLIQTTGKGANGSFKLPGKLSGKPKDAKKKVAKRGVSTVKKTINPKKTKNTKKPVSKKRSTVKVEEAETKGKSSSKVKEGIKEPGAPPVQQKISSTRNISASKSTPAM